MLNCKLGMIQAWLTIRSEKSNPAKSAGGRLRCASVRAKSGSKRVDLVCVQRQEICVDCIGSQMQISKNHDKGIDQQQLGLRG